MYQPPTYYSIIRGCITLLAKESSNINTNSKAQVMRQVLTLEDFE